MIQRPRSDLGTIVVHWLITASLLGAALTGLAIASVDFPDLWLVHHLGFLLPGENVWPLHLEMGIALIGSLAAYVTYMSRANLGGRVAFTAARLRALFMTGRPRWAAVNMLLYWMLFIALTLEILSGLLLFLGFGGMLTIHLHLTWFFLAYLVLHPTVHWLYGGEGQLWRIFRPQIRIPQPAPQLVDALIEHVQLLEAGKSYPDSVSKPPARGRPPKQAVTVAMPLAIAVAAGAAMLPLSTTVDERTRQSLRIVKIDAAMAPDINGDLSDAAWRRAPMTTVLTQHGANFEGGDSLIEVRAIHDGTFAYFAFTWTDPTRSLKHMPLVKREDGWHLMRSASAGNETQFYEDKFAVLLVAGGQPLLGKGIHFGRQPLRDKPESATGRGLHYLAAGVGDIWQWRAAHGGMAGWVDNGHFGAPLPASATEAAGRYTGGFALDPEPAPYRDNFDSISGEDTYPRVRPLRFPRTAARILRIESLNVDPENSDEGSYRSWLTADDSVPYSEELDRLLPSGAVIPSVLLTTVPVNRPDFAGPTGMGHWAGGRWCLEVRRRLDTGRPFDVAIKTGALMWVAAFDHAETWHTYHVRPLKLEVE